ncbi:MAG TPA: hypothetical protein VKB70_06815, partial [Gaiellaceae bacterium]|nr:hypothetical protein [Gaiellaceae bacterium]
MAIALLDVLPEAERELGRPDRVSLLVALGFVVFFLANRLLGLHHRDDSDQARAHHRVGAMGAFALSAHSMVDGLGIGLALHLSLGTGLLVFATVASHDFFIFLGASDLLPEAHKHPSRLRVAPDGRRLRP